MLKIRRYQPKDNTTVKTLHFAGLEQFGAKANRYLDDDLDNIEERYLNNNGDFLVGIESNEMVVIGAIRKVTSTRGEIKRIRVSKDFQRKGYGQAILLKLIERGEKLGYNELILDTMAHNIPAQRLFEKHGFFETHRVKFGPDDLVFYKRVLK